MRKMKKWNFKGPKIQNNLEYKILGKFKIVLNVKIQFLRSPPQALPASAIPTSSVACVKRSLPQA